MSPTRSFLIAALLLTAAIAAAAAYIMTRPQPAPVDAPAASQAGEAAPASAEIAATPAPSFDIVRVDPRGTAVVAGRGAPGAEVSLVAGEAVIATVEIDENGEWVMIIDEPLETGTVELSLVMRTPTGQEIRSDQVVVMSIPESRDATPLVVLGRPGEASRVLQGPFDGLSMGPLTLSTVDYDEGGTVIFSGRAEPGAQVRVLADGSVVGETRADSFGRWDVQAGASFEPGLYDLQVDMLDADGRVTAVIALPFERAAPEDVQLRDGRVVVQPGNSLWRIARRLYGEGVQYTVIYEANRDQIRDPDLIYPGQLFTTPGVQETEPDAPPGLSNGG